MFHIWLFSSLAPPPFALHCLWGIKQFWIVIFFLFPFLLSFLSLICFWVSCIYNVNSFVTDIYNVNWKVPFRNILLHSVKIPLLLGLTNITQTCHNCVALQSYWFKDTEHWRKKTKQVLKCSQSISILILQEGVRSSVKQQENGAMRTEIYWPTPGKR